MMIAHLTKMSDQVQTFSFSKSGPPVADSVDDRIGQVINYIKTILYECRTNKAEKMLI